MMATEAMRSPATPDGVPASMAVIGGGTMGTGIAYVFAVAGADVTVVEPSDVQAAVMAASLRTALEAGVSRGRLGPGDVEVVLHRIRRVHGIADIAVGSGLIVESVPERTDLKREVLVSAERREPLLLATNTSSVSIDVLASALDRPERLIGMHFFNPVWSLMLVELVRGAATSRGSIERAQEVVEAIGKQSILVADVPGFATSRLDLIAALEAIRMVEDGVASAADIDLAATVAYRHPVGPLRLSDIVGLDVRLDIARSLESAYGERYRPPQLLIDMVRSGRLGRKSGRGFYDWT